MDILSPLLQLLFRALFVLLPLTVSWLAFRRLMRSRSANAWIYAASCLFTSVTAAGLLPWTLGVGSASWHLFMFSAISPAIWMGVVMICDPVKQPSNYDSDAPDNVMIAQTFTLPIRTKIKATRPLVLEQPDWPGAPTPVFRHKPKAANAAKPPAKAPEPKSKLLLSVARGMRGNDTSEPRRPRLLPAPDRYGNDLPFLHRS